MARRRLNKRKFYKRLILIIVPILLISSYFVGKNMGAFGGQNNKKSVAVVNSNQSENKDNVKQSNNIDSKNDDKNKNNPNDNKVTTNVDNIKEQKQDNILLAKKVNDNSYDIAKIQDILDGKAPKDGKKIAFLTFDDGPSTTVTPTILSVLKQYDVKATFFLVGENIDKNEKSKELVKQEFDDGHAIGNHTYTHNKGNKLYPGNKIDIPFYFEEIDKNATSIKNIVGQDFKTRTVRLPGGYNSRQYYKDPGLPELNTKLKQRELYSIDWNSLTGDAEGGKKRYAPEFVERIKKESAGIDKLVILMHDTYGKEETAKALPQIIEYLKSQGYEFKNIQ